MIIQNNVIKGGSSFRFFNIESTVGEGRSIVCLYASTVKSKNRQFLLPIGFLLEGGIESLETINAIAIDVSSKFYIEGSWVYLSEMVDGLIESYGIIEISEEEFYNLSE